MTKGSKKYGPIAPKPGGGTARTPVALPKSTAPLFVPSGRLAPGKTAAGTRPRRRLQGPLVISVTIIIVVVAITLRTLLSPPALNADLHDLARYFPANTTFFAGFDRAAIPDLNRAASEVGLTPILATTTYAHQLNTAFTQLPDDNNWFRAFEPWLGDQGAFGFYPDPAHPDQLSLVAAMEITDAEGIRHAFDNLIAVTPLVQWQREETASYTRYGLVPITVTVHSDVLLLALNAPAVSTSVVTDNLGGTAQFNALMRRLNDLRYNAVFYANVPPTLLSSLPLGTNPLTIGAAASMDDQRITIDLAYSVDYRTGNILSGAFASGTGINSRFLDLMPENALFSMQSRDFARLYRDFLQRLTTEWGGLLAQIDLDGVTTTLSAVINILIGIDYERDLLPWMNGSFGVFAEPMPSGALQLTAVFENTDPRAVSNFMTLADTSLSTRASIANLLSAGITIHREQFDDTRLLVLEISDWPEPNIFVIGANSRAFAVGTQTLTRETLARVGQDQGQGTTNRSHFLPNATVTYSLNLSTLIEIPLANDLTNRLGLTPMALEQLESLSRSIGQLYMSGNQPIDSMNSIRLVVEYDAT